MELSDNLGSHLSGFVDGEGNFTIGIFKSSGSRLGYNVHPMFVVGQAEKEILELFKKILGCGHVRQRKMYYKDASSRSGLFELRVQDSKDCLYKVVPFFEKYPLLTKKKNDFLLWKIAVQMITRGEHLTRKGLIKIIEIKQQIEQGRSHKGRKNVRYNFIGRHDQIPVSLESWVKEK